MCGSEGVCGASGSVSWPPSGPYWRQRACDWEAKTEHHHQPHQNLQRFASIVFTIPRTRHHHKQGSSKNRTRARARSLSLAREHIMLSWDLHDAAGGFLFSFVFVFLDFVFWPPTQRICLICLIHKLAARPRRFGGAAVFCWTRSSEAVGEDDPERSTSSTLESIDK